MIKAIVVGLMVALFLRFGLEPIAWVFYEASHVLSVDWLYWGYSVFRGADAAFQLFDYRTLSCALTGSAVTGLLYYRSHRAI